MRFKIKIAIWLLSALILIVLFLLWFQSSSMLNSLMDGTNNLSIKAVSDQLNILMALIFVLVMLTMGMGLVGAKLVSGDIMKLRDAAREMGRGKLKTRIKIDTGDELQELAESLNRMAQSLEQSERELEKKNLGLERAVKKRTKELQDKVNVLERLNKLSVGREVKMIELKERVKKLEKRLINRK
jgi:nitrate/nitrite-specific signal transduction histidine kinase